MIAFMSDPQTGCFSGARTGADIESRFWSKVDRTSDPTGCWPWLACKGENGYGQINISDKTERAHRFAFTLVNGSIPPGLCVCHHCDNRKCCRPDHLFLGSPADNSADMCRKGRHAKAKLTPDQVREIRAASGTQREIALRFGITQTSVSYIKLGKTWKQVTP